MNYVIKIKYEDTLRRLTYPGNGPHGDKIGDKLTFAKLETKIRDLFKLPASAAVRVTYTDKDNDVITMGDDQDLEDACVLQGLNPLRLDVTLVEIKTVGPAERQDEQRSSAPSSKEVVPNLKQMLQGLPAEVIKPVADQVQQLLKGTTVSPRQLADLVDTVVHTVTSHIDTAVRKVDPDTHNVPAEGLTSSGGAAVPPASQHHPVWRVNRTPVNQHPNVPVATGILNRTPVNQHPNLPVATGIPVPTPAPVLRTVNGGISVHRSISDNDDPETGNACRVFHSGVQCDGCGMNPIVGPRFKSTEKHDYDLCVSCFKESASPGDYNRIDRPLFRPRHLRCPAMIPKFHAGRGIGVTTRGAYGAKPDHLRPAMHQTHGSSGKLDARFVQDVTIYDGAELPPVTGFTKIWRLRNSGTLSWPMKTMLVHVGGDELGSVIDVPLELPENGLAPGEEVEVSVDLVAPEKPGRYVSHWRLASPGGQKFGHRVWVLIQVVSKVVYEDAAINERSSPLPSKIVTKEDTVFAGDAKQAVCDTKVEDSTQGVRTGHTLFLAKEYPTGLSSLLADSDVTSMKEVTSEQPSAPAGPAFVDIVPDFQVAKSMSGSTEEDLISGDEEYQRYVKADFPLEEERVDQAVAVEGHYEKIDPVSTERVSGEDVPAFVNSELGGFSMVEMPGLVSSSSSITSVSAVSLDMDPASSPAARHSSSFSPKDSSVITEEQKEEVDVTAEGEGALRLTSLGLCEKLEGMGFSDKKLNLELLEKNDLDLRRTLDDLFAAAEWDPILEELEEMGFYDLEMNRRLMFKNNGSVKRVVKELVQMYKEPVGASKDKGKGKEAA